MKPPSGFSTPPHIPNINTTERPLVTTIMFATTTPGHTSFAYRASTSTDPTPMISPDFIEANNEILESLKVTPPLRTRSPRVHRQGKRVVGFEEDSNREQSRIGRNIEGNGPLEAGAEENERREMYLPLLLVAHLGRNKDGQPSRSSLTSIHRGRQSSINTGGNLPPNDPTRSVTPFVCWIEEYPLPDRVKMPSYVGSYDGKEDPDNFLHLFEGAIRMKKWPCLWPVTCLHLPSKILLEYC
nr:reverse transcriptase domain-containing protein [Tanacetum cinerariifolium]